MTLAGRQIHFVGIGGVGMSALARMALDQGAVVSGCDARDGAAVRAFVERGCTVHRGHDASHLLGVELVVRSSAIAEESTEIQAALRMHIPVVSRARMLARFMAGRCVIGIAGAHGKTTTTWIVGKLLIEARRDPSVVVGGIVRELGGNYRLGSGACFVAEVDESDGSLLEFSPHYSIVTNIDHEHVDRYPDLASMQETFRRYLARTEPGGCVIVGADSAPAVETLGAWEGQRTTYGLCEGADFQATNVRLNCMSATFDVSRPSGELKDLVLALPGRHNVQNALAAVALAAELGIADDVVRRAFSRLTSVGRRLETKGTAGGVLVLDDYAHHPTEIQALLDTARRVAKGRIIGVFQPHRYTRTLHLADRFGTCFEGLDLLVILPIYGAGEKPIDGVDAGLIERAVREHGGPPCVCCGDADAARSFLLGVLEPGDTLLTIGAGDVYRLGEQILDGLGGEGRA